MAEERDTERILTFRQLGRRQIKAQVHGNFAVIIFKLNSEFLPRISGGLIERARWGAGRN